MTSSPVILKLGGSLVVPKDIDAAYLKRFVQLVKKHVKQGRRFIIIVGGGYTNRWYRDRARELGVKNATDLHWIGTISTHLNAEFVRALFGKLAHPRPYWDFSQNISWREPILAVGGHAPGHSTDYDAVLMAQKFKSQRIINVSNVAYLYTGDPKKDGRVEPILEISWKAYREMFGNPREHRPGQNIPIDAVAASASERLRLETFYVGGHDLKNIDQLLSGKSWRGTRIYGV